MDYYKKYLKYKNKYLDLKGGSDNNPVTPFTLNTPPTPQNAPVTPPNTQVNPNINVVTPNNRVDQTITIQGRNYNIFNLFLNLDPADPRLPDTHAVISDADVTRIQNAYLNLVTH